jgi:glycosyltransferase involved in cell wall biosynthesis
MTDLAVIMSVYINDRLEFVKESVNSILLQSFSVFHFYIVFDGPVKEDVEDFITSLTDQRIKISRLEKNTGLAGALNHLLEKILHDQDYKLIARMDADDVSMPERFDRQYRFMNCNPDIGCVGSWYEEIDEYGSLLHYRKLPVLHEALRKRYFTRTPFAHPTVMFRKSLIEMAGPYPSDSILMEDNVLWGRALKAGFRFANIPEYLFKFRIDENFYRRRSGVKYGWSYIKTRFAILKYLKSPSVYFLFPVLIGTIKMMPPFFGRLFYRL